MADGYNDERSSTSPAARERRNTLWLECYQVVVRVGWIFKTETIIMPAVLDAVVDSGLLRAYCRCSTAAARASRRSPSRRRSPAGR